MKRAEISKFLAEIGVKPHIKGFLYLEEALVLCSEAGGKVLPMTSFIYPKVAEIHSTTSSRVERAMRHAIENLMTRWSSSREFYESLGLSPKFMLPSILTNTEFISLVLRFWSK